MVKRALFVALLCSCEPPSVVDRTKEVSSLGSASSSHVSVRCVPVGGSHITVTMRTERMIEGELLAATSNKLTVLVADGAVSRIDAGEVDHAQLDIYANGTIVGLLTLWGVIGTAASLSHGAYFIFSGPSWALVSTLAIAPVAADPDRFVRVTSDLERLHQYARFPGGLPASFEDARAHTLSSCD
jgi:hypothetical protein